MKSIEEMPLEQNIMSYCSSLTSSDFRETFRESAGLKSPPNIIKKCFAPATLLLHSSMAEMSAPPTALECLRERNLFSQLLFTQGAAECRIDESIGIAR